ncbi:MAG: hypothetical protein ABJF50_09420 [Paracoccaceae bacterium]
MSVKRVSGLVADGALVFIGQLLIDAVDRLHEEFAQYATRR